MLDEIVKMTQTELSEMDAIAVAAGQVLLQGFVLVLQQQRDLDWH